VELADALRGRIRTIPDFPKPGIAFMDITPILQDPPLLRRCVAALGGLFGPDACDAVGGVESRGLIFGALVAHETARPFFPLRKPGKLPGRCLRESYALEYGESTLEMHEDAFTPGARVLLVDDLLATGGTAAAAVRLVRRGGGVVAGIGFVVELDALGGRESLRAEGVPEAGIRSLVHFGA
jgi:adenine phosphoribosyltransferase